MTPQASARTTQPALIAEKPLGPTQPVLVLFGRNTASRPCAAWFDAADAEAATTAATTMQLRTFSITDEPGRDLAKQCARGRMLPSGRALVPFAKQALYARLIALAGEEAAPTPSARTESTETNAAPADATPVIAAKDLPPSRPGDRTFVGNSKPDHRDEIGLGSVVLAHDGPDEGWWEAEVIGINGRVFSLRWHGWPTEPTILRKAGELALLPPGEA